jgi:hypothetical protein
VPLRILLWSMAEKYKSEKKNTLGKKN